MNSDDNNKSKNLLYISVKIRSLFILHVQRTQYATIYFPNCESHPYLWGFWSWFADTSSGCNLANNPIPALFVCVPEDVWPMGQSDSRSEIFIRGYRKIPFFRAFAQHLFRCRNIRLWDLLVFWSIYSCPNIFLLFIIYWADAFECQWPNYH